MSIIVFIISIWSVICPEAIGSILGGRKLYLDNTEFNNFKKKCSETGTTEESIANAEKIGFKTNLLAINPLDKNNKVPVFFANFVLMDYGFGAVFGCPAHDQRDLDFANEYKLEIIPVVKPNNIEENEFKINDIAYTEDGTIINSKLLNGLSIKDAKKRIIVEIENKKIGRKKTKKQMMIRL